ncbi:TetR/AcrR family transcriptional regulator [Aureimonas sp. AU4]|uniref:TetR/AcrR family transcriptional regulator n=1 Tax=Aureimonas sp. AU4 TaxID=1638163 RepID=UPI0035B6023C
MLDAALSLLVERGDKLTMTAVAREASCSKETLYKWFGDRDGLLAATVRHQASRIRGLAIDDGHLDRESLRSGLERFALDWLQVITGPTSIALNRLAVGQAGTSSNDLGLIVLRNGPDGLRKRLTPLLLGARDEGLLAFEDPEEAFGTFFGLVVGDVQLRMLLGDPQPVGARDLAHHAATAAQQFLTLYGTARPERSGSPAGRT